MAAPLTELTALRALIDFERDGAAAEFVTVPETDLAGKPSTVSHAVAAALPLAGLTALQALVDHAAVRPGEAVLVHGGAGGVGAFAVQLAAILGARVTATVRSDARQLVSGFGAQRVIDVRSETFDESAAFDPYDVVVDTVGGATLDRSFGVLRPGGSADHLVGTPAPGEGRRIRRHRNVFHRHSEPSAAGPTGRTGRWRPAARGDRGDLSARQGAGSLRKRAAGWSARW